MQFVEIELDPGETVIAEAGSLMMMENEIKMETIFGDGSSKQSGFMDKLLGAEKRVLTGESLFMTTFTNDGTGKRHVSFASPFPGDRKSTRLNSSHVAISYAVFCLKKKTLYSHN